MFSKTPAAVSSISQPPVGTLIDGDSLELVEVLGVGGYAVVYRAVDVHSPNRKPYAVKCLVSQPHRTGRQRQLHIREIALHQIASSHPGIVTLHRVVEDANRTYIIMDYAPDRDLLTQIFHSCRYLGDDALIKHVFLQLLDAVEYCHNLGIYHRDLKPENIVCFDDGLRVAITEFGLVTTDKVSDEFRTGSVYYMSPECQGGVFAPTGNYSPMFNDIWSLGIILLNLVTGRNPWGSATSDDQTFQAYLRDPLGFLPTVLPISPEINDILTRMLEVDWRERMTLRELRHAIEDVNSFYSDSVVFEGSMARCPWESGMDIDSESSWDTPTRKGLTMNAEAISWGTFSAIRGDYYDNPTIPDERGKILMLDHFRVYSSKRDSARQWLDSSQERLLKYVSSQDGLTLNDKAFCTYWAKNGAIYERFTIYIYEHLKTRHAAFQTTAGHLAELRNCIGTWSTWDVVKAISQHHIVSDRLRAFCVWENEEHLQRIIALDIDSLCARLYLILHDREQYQTLANLPEEQSQVVLNLLQTLLDSTSLDPSFRSTFVNALLRVARKTGLYPEVLLQNCVTLEGEDAVAAGQFGDVWKGTYKGQKVAVKVLKLYVQSDLMKHLKKVSYEMLIWRQLRHSNVLPFLCLYHVNGHRARVGLVSPWMENGNLQQYLRQDPDADRVSLVQDVANGLEYLHTMQPSIVHGDLKAVNILITDARRACLADFGLSTASQSQVLNLSSFSGGKAGGTSRWTAPELLTGTVDMNNISSDVYAFGCTLYEVRDHPVAETQDYDNDYPVILKIIQGQRPPRPSYCIPSGASCSNLGLDDHMWSIVEACWLPEPTDRPTMSVINTRLPKLPIPMTQPAHGNHQHPPGQDLVSWAISSRDGRIGSCPMMPFQLPDKTYQNFSPGQGSKKIGIKFGQNDPLGQGKTRDKTAVATSTMTGRVFRVFTKLVNSSTPISGKP